MNLRPYQQRGVELGLAAASAREPRRLLLAAPTGSGKCLRLGTPVMMFDGTVKRVEDVMTGDVLMGPDSRPRNVLSTTRGHGQLYRVQPVKGDAYFVNEEHILSLVRTETNEIENVPVRDYIGRSKWYKHIAKGYRVPVEFPSRAPMPINPYFVGLWLGDGTSNHSTITKPDPEIRDFVHEYAGLLGLVVRESRNSSGCPSYHITRKDRLSRNVLLDALRVVCLIPDKQVPREYLTASREDRLQVLAGLLDSDGHMTRAGFDFISKRRHISDAVVWLSRSLGLAAYISTCQKRASNGTQVEPGTYYRVSVSGDCSIIPNRIARKKAPKRQQKKDVLRVGITVTPDVCGDYAGFELDGDSLFLLEDFTVTHNSLVEQRLLAALPDSILVTPAREIIDGLVDKGADETRLWTPIRLRNRLLDGSVAPPPVILLDETHHSEAESWQHILASCDAVEIGFTATPYRGTPRSTAAFRDYWGPPEWLIRYPEALEAGYITLPVCRTDPLVDDDLVTVNANGEFDVQSIEAVTGSKISDFAALIDGIPLDRPTMLALTTRELCRMVAERLRTACVIVDGDTPRAERLAAFAACLRCERLLIQIAVVSEGVDLPIRRIIDAAPTMSPVRWVQLIGRAMRPCPACGGRRCDCGCSEYIGTNRNLLRHSYAIQGVMPTSKLVEAQAAFGGVGTRAGMRVVGLEGLGRFKPNDVKLASGLNATVYMVEGKDTGVAGGTRQYTCITHPASETPFWATRVNVAGAYGRWQRCDAPAGFTGFASGRPSALSDKQRAWWERDAVRFGLDASPENVTRKTFSVLPVLADTRTSIT